jgi:hypothetical protein
MVSLRASKERRTQLAATSSIGNVRLTFSSAALEGSGPSSETCYLGHDMRAVLASSRDFGSTDEVHCLVYCLRTSAASFARRDPLKEYD